MTFKAEVTDRADGVFATSPGRCLVIGEVAQAHDGSLGTAHAFIDAIAAAGADAVKFQAHIAAAESTPAEQWRVRFSPQDETRYDYWKRMEFTPPQWAELKRHADERSLLFVVSPFSIAAVELMRPLRVGAWKVASGEVGSTPLLKALAATGQPILISSGMSPMSEIDAAVAVAARGESPVAVMQCTSAYPCPPERIGLNLLPLLRDRYGCAVGLSDHSGTIFPGLAAAALGCDVLEVHVTLSREMFGPDVSASVTTTEFRQLVDGVRFIDCMNDHPVDKDVSAGELGALRALFTKSVVARVDLAEGQILEEQHVSIKKPGTGIPASRLGEVIGARLRRSVAADDLLRDTDLERLA